jgi:hypothetical protein
MTATRFELQRWECRSLAESQRVGRFCVVDHGTPIAYPVNYVVVGFDDEPKVVVRTAPDTVLGRYTGPASLLVDQIDEHAGQAWSVIARGNVRHVAGAHGLPDPHPLLVSDRHHWLTLDVTAWSGRRFSVSGGDDGTFVDWELRPA